MNTEPGKPTPKVDLFVWVTRVASLISFLLLIGGFGWLITGNIRFRTSLAEMAGTNKLNSDLNERIDHMSNDIGKSIVQLSGAITELSSRISEMKADTATRAMNASADRDELKASQETVVNRLKAVEAAVNTNLDPSPPIRFLQTGNFVKSTNADGEIHIGDVIRISWSYIKEKDCGPALPANLIMDQQDVTARLENVSTLNAEGQGIISRVDKDQPLNITYTAKIPDDKGLIAGQAQVWVAVAYSEGKCPAAEPTESPHLPINLLPARK